MVNDFRSINFRNPILPDTAVSGFIFTNLDEGEKVVQVDLIASQQVKFFTFFVQIPGMRVDYQMVDFDTLYPKADFRARAHFYEPDRRNQLGAPRDISNIRVRANTNLS